MSGVHLRLFNVRLHNVVAQEVFAKSIEFQVNYSEGEKSEITNRVREELKALDGTVPDPLHPLVLPIGSVAKSLPVEVPYVHCGKICSTTMHLGTYLGNHKKALVEGLFTVEVEVSATPLGMYRPLYFVIIGVDNGDYPLRLTSDRNESDQLNYQYPGISNEQMEEFIKMKSPISSQ